MEEEPKGHVWTQLEPKRLTKTDSRQVTMAFHLLMQKQPSIIPTHLRRLPPSKQLTLGQPASRQRVKMGARQASKGNANHQQVEPDPPASHPGQSGVTRQFCLHCCTLPTNTSSTPRNLQDSHEETAVETMEPATPAAPPSLDVLACESLGSLLCHPGHCPGCSNSEGVAQQGDHIAHWPG